MNTFPPIPASTGSDKTAYILDGNPSLGRLLSLEKKRKKEKKKGKKNVKSTEP